MNKVSAPGLSECSHPTPVSESAARTDVGFGKAPSAKLEITWPRSRVGFAYAQIGDR
jgi:hypothetical protein